MAPFLFDNCFLGVTIYDCCWLNISKTGVGSSKGIYEIGLLVSLAGGLLTSSFTSSSVNLKAGLFFISFLLGEFVIDFFSSIAFNSVSSFYLLFSFFSVDFISIIFGGLATISLGCCSFSSVFFYVGDSNDRLSSLPDELLSDISSFSWVLLTFLTVGLNLGEVGAAHFNSAVSTVKLSLS